MYLRNHSCAGFVTAGTLIIITTLTKPFWSIHVLEKIYPDKYIHMAIRLHSFSKRLACTWLLKL